MSSPPAPGPSGRPPPGPDVPRRLLVYRHSALARRHPVRTTAVVTVAAAAIGIPAYLWLGGSDPDSPRELGDPEVSERMMTAGPAVSRPLIPVDGFEQTGAVGTEITLTVRAVDALGAPLPDTVVRFRIEEGEGDLGAEEARTNVRGLASVPLLLPERPSHLVVVAAVAGSPTPEIRIDVEAAAGAPERVRATQGDAQSGSTGDLLPRPLGLLVTDADGNPVRGVEVRFEIVSGNGRVAPTRMRTDTAGRATARWRLGDRPGEQRLAALVPSAQDAVVTFRATARGTAGAVSSPPAEGTPPGAPQTPAEADVPDEATESGPVTVARRAYVVGGSHVCRLAGGRAACRGGNDRGQRGTGAAQGFVFLTAGVSHTCALDADGSVSCWGANESGQLGDGSTTDRPAPTPASTEARFSALAAGLSHTCGLSAGGRPLCWGLNLNGQVGDGTRDDRNVPRRVAGDPSFRTLAAGWSHTCGLDGEGSILCWGLNSSGQLGEGSKLDRLIPTRVGGGFQSVVAGSSHTCAIRGAEVVCWGQNGFGQLGDGTTTDRTRPVAVRGLPAAPIRLAAGAVHTCALVRGGAAWCWGQNVNGQLGDGTNQNRAVATAVEGGLTFTTIDAGGAVTCGFGSDGQEYCWGLNQSGQLGDGSRVNRPVPTPVGGGQDAPE